MGFDYTPSELIDIIKSAKESGVAQLEIGDKLLVSFLPLVPKALNGVAAPTPEQIRAAKEYEGQLFSQNEQRIREEQLLNLRLSDPEAYEDLVNRGELNAREESDRIDS